MTFSSAIRNPTLLNQYMYYNIGRAKLVGNISGYDSSHIGVIRRLLVSQNRDTLNYFNLGPIEPERVRSIEMGYEDCWKRLYGASGIIAGIEILLVLLLEQIFL